MSKFTPGPWLHKGHGVVVGGPRIEYVNGSAQQQIAMSLRPHVLTNEDSAEVRDANARLIAMAPELYEALQEAARVLSDLPSTNQAGTRTRAAWERIRAVLAKVDG